MYELPNFYKSSLLSKQEYCWVVQPNMVLWALKIEDKYELGNNCVFRHKSWW